MRFGKRLAALVGTAVGGTTLVAAAAFACTNLATLHLSSGSGAPGSIVAVTGSATEAAHGAGGTNPVVLHWNGVDGPVLATAEPDAAGEIHATFSVPEARPGTYVITATQRGARGTPARAAYEISAPGGAGAGTSSAAGLGSDTSSSGVMAVTGGLGALGLGLFGAGVATFVRQTRRRPSAVAVKVHR